MDREDSDERDSDDDRDEDPRRKRRFCNERDNSPIETVTKSNVRLPSLRDKLARSNRQKNQSNKIEIVRKCIRKNFHHEKSKPIPTLGSNNNLITIRSSTANVQPSSTNHNNKFRLRHQKVPQTNEYTSTHLNVHHINQINSTFNGSQTGLCSVSSQSSSGPIATTPKIHVNPHFVKKFLRKSDNSESFGNDDADLSSAPHEAIHLAAAVVAANIVSANKLVSVTRSDHSSNGPNVDPLNTLITQDKNNVSRPHNIGQSELTLQRNFNINETMSDHSGNGGQPIPVIGGSPNTVYSINPSAIHFKRRQNACHQHSLPHSRFNQYSDHQRFHLSKAPTNNHFNSLSSQQFPSTSYGSKRSCSVDSSLRSSNGVRHRELGSFSYRTPITIDEAATSLQEVEKSTNQQTISDDKSNDILSPSVSESTVKQIESATDIQL